jgi:transposase-like protein
MRLYSDSGLTVGEIARRFGVSPATISNRAKQLGLKQRGRGRWKRETPDAPHKQMLLLLDTESQASVARRFGVSRQRVNQIVRRWKDWQSDRSKARGRSRLQPSYRITFRINKRAFIQLETALNHPWFKSLRSPNQAACEIVNNFLSTIFRRIQFSKSESRS